MIHKRGILLLVLALVVLIGAWAAASNSVVDQKSVLSGTVLSSNLASAGSIVREGDVLVVVDSITGPVPAVRATVDGKVKEVLVKPGDMIRTGDVLVRIEAAHK